MPLITALVSRVEMGEHVKTSRMGTNVSANPRITHVAVRKVTGSQLIITYGRHSDCEKGREQVEKPGRVFLNQVFR